MSLDTKMLISMKTLWNMINKLYQHFIILQIIYRIELFLKSKKNLVQCEKNEYIKFFIFQNTFR